MSSFEVAWVEQFNNLAVSVVGYPDDVAMFVDEVMKAAKAMQADTTSEEQVVIVGNEGDPVPPTARRSSTSANPMLRDAAPALAGGGSAKVVLEDVFPDSGSDAHARRLSTGANPMLRDAAPARAGSEATEAVGAPSQPGEADGLDDGLFIKLLGIKAVHWQPATGAVINKRGKEARMVAILAGKLAHDEYFANLKVFVSEKDQRNHDSITTMVRKVEAKGIVGIAGNNVLYFPVTSLNSTINLAEERVETMPLKDLNQRIHQETVRLRAKFDDALKVCPSKIADPVRTQFKALIKACSDGVVEDATKSLVDSTTAALTEDSREWEESLKQRLPIRREELVDACQTKQNDLNRSLQLALRECEPPELLDGKQGELTETFQRVRETLEAENELKLNAFIQSTTSTLQDEAERRLDGATAKGKPIGVLAAELSAVEGDIVRRLGEALGTLCPAEAVDEQCRQVRKSVDDKKREILRGATHQLVDRTMAALTEESEKWKESQESALPIRSEALASACDAKETDLKGKLRSALHECNPPSLVGEKQKAIVAVFRQMRETLAHQNTVKLNDLIESTTSGLKDEAAKRLDRAMGTKGKPLSLEKLTTDLQVVEDDIKHKLGEVLGTLCSAETIDQARLTVQKSVEAKKREILRGATQQLVDRTMAALTEESKNWKESQESMLPIRSDALASACDAKETELKGKLRSALHECNSPSLVGEKQKAIVTIFRQMCEALKHQNTVKLKERAAVTLANLKEEAMTQLSDTAAHDSTPLGDLSTAFDAMRRDVSAKLNEALGALCPDYLEEARIQLLGTIDTETEKRTNTAARKLADDVTRTLKTEGASNLEESLSNARYKSEHVRRLGARQKPDESSKDGSFGIDRGETCWGIEVPGNYIKVPGWMNKAVVYFPMKPGHFSKQDSVMSEGDASKLCTAVRESLIEECTKQLEACPQAISDEARTRLAESFADVSARFKEKHTFRLKKFVEDSEAEFKKFAMEELRTKLTNRLPLSADESGEVVELVKGNTLGLRATHRHLSTSHTQRNQMHAQARSVKCLRKSSPRHSLVSTTFGKAPTRLFARRSMSTQQKV